MGSGNSQGELCSEFYSKLFTDLCVLYPEDSHNLMRDLRTLKRRFLHEGLELFTVTFPRLGKALDEALETSYFKPPVGWESQNNSVCPRFMGVFWNRIFDSSGNLADVSTDAIRNLRQVLYFCYKLELPYSASLTRGFIDDFVKKDNSIDNDFDYDSTQWGRRAREIVENVFRSFDFKEIVPKHGPGAVATGEKYDEKWTFNRHYSALHACYPYYEYMYTSMRHLFDRKEHYLQMARHQSGCAKVVLVPKDSRGPRLISCEPLEYQYIQQGIMRSIVPRLELTGPTAQTLNFSNQKINQKLALESSKTRDYCTLDLKDASDMVSQGLVKYLFQEKYRYLDATRSTHTKLPDGTIHELKKFAPMGSALCFPIEAMCFWAICVGSVSEFTGWRWQQIARTVYVYGDDIIVPDKYYGIVVRALTEAGLIVNLGKSFTSGFFRESCGVDAYNGSDVTPIRLKTIWSGNPEDGRALESYCSTAAMLKQRGYDHLAEYIYSRVEKTYGRLPYGTCNAGYPCRLVDTYDQAVRMSCDMLAPLRKYRIHSGFQVPQIKVTHTRKAPMKTSLDTWERLHRNIVSPVQNPEQVVGLLPLKIRQGWMTIK